jgi:hypothetical protein
MFRWAFFAFTFRLSVSQHPPTGLDGAGGRRYQGYLTPSPRALRRVQPEPIVEPKLARRAFVKPFAQAEAAVWSRSYAVHRRLNLGAAHPIVCPPTWQERRSPVPFSGDSALTFSRVVSDALLVGNGSIET